MAETVIEIVKKYLTEHGYDGLYNSDGECACLVANLCPGCECGFDECEAGYLRPCDCGDHEYHIGRKRPDERPEVSHA